MKPDKHKKEKNAIYKKKHGITDGNKQEQKSNEPIRDTKAKDKALSFGVVPSRPTSNGGEDSASRKHGRSDKQGKETFPSSSEKTQMETMEANYRRRKVVSNWERYEIEETTAPTLRGSDFAALLNSCASVFSHSQYRDELGLMNTEDSEQNTSAKFLILDCDDLASSLMCIPLHERLGIEDSVFEPVILQRFFELSKESASKYATACDKMKPSSVAASVHTSTDTSNNSAEEQITAMSHDPLLEISDKESNGLLLTEDDSGDLPVKNLPSGVQDSTSSSELDSKCLNSTTSTDIALTEAVGQAESELRNETPLSALNASNVNDKTVAGTRRGTAQRRQSLKELENELDLLLAL